MLVLQTICKEHSKKDGDVITRLNVTPTASQCTISKSETQYEVKGEGECVRERISSLTQGDGCHTDADRANNSEG